MALATVLVVGGCKRNQAGGGSDDEGGASSGNAGGEEPGPPPEDWPSVLIIGPGSGPALYLGPEEGAFAVGYLSSGIHIQLKNTPTNNHIQILIKNTLTTKT